MSIMISSTETVWLEGIGGRFAIHKAVVDGAVQMSLNPLTNYPFPSPYQ